MRITASDVAHITGGLLVGTDSTADGVSFDSRTLLAGQMFVAIVGERDGHEFLHDAQRAGAAFALVGKGRSIDGLTCIEVSDTTVALALIGAHCRKSLAESVGNRVVGITGSAGKTSTKNMVREVLRAGFTHVHAADHSLNNDIGVPVTIMNAPTDTDALVIEMGMRGFHEIDRLCRIAQPIVGIVTNIGDAHGERVGGSDGIARAKGELLEALPSHGTAIVNRDDVYFSALAARANCDVLSFGAHQSADMRWTIQSIDHNGVCTALLHFGGDVVSIVPALPGEHMVANAAAAVLAGVACGLSLEVAASGIGEENVEKGRMKWQNTTDGRRVLDDTYNANTASMIAALHVLASSTSGEKVAVLGAMAEITDAAEGHRRVASTARDLGIEIIAVDTDLYGVQGVSVDDAISRLASMEWSVALVKGSRATRMERVVDQLLAFG